MAKYLSWPALVTNGALTDNPVAVRFVTRSQCRRRTGFYFHGVRFEEHREHDSGTA